MPIVLVVTQSLHRAYFVHTITNTETLNVGSASLVEGLAEELIVFWRINLLSCSLQTFLPFFLKATIDFGLGTKALTKFVSGGSGSMSRRAGLVFPVTRVKRMIQVRWKGRVGKGKNQFRLFISYCAFRSFGLFGRSLGVYDCGGA